MKYTKKVVNWMIACAVALAMVTSASAETKETIVKIIRIKGSARYSTGKNVWQALEVGTILKSGAIIQTASSSTVDLVIAEEGAKAGSGPAGGRPVNLKAFEDYQPKSQYDVIRLWEDCVLAIDKLTVTTTGADKVTDTQLDLRAGRIFFAVKKVSAASTFEIKIPNGVAGIRGSVGMCSALGILGMAQGQGAISYRSPSGPVVKAVEAGFQFDIRTGDFSRIAEILFGEFDKFLELPRTAAQTTSNPQAQNNTQIRISPNTGLDE